MDFLTCTRLYILIRETLQMMTALGRRRIVEMAREGRSHHIFSPSYPSFTGGYILSWLPWSFVQEEGQSKEGTSIFPFLCLSPYPSSQLTDSPQKADVMNAPQGALHKLPLKCNFCLFFCQYFCLFVFLSFCPGITLIKCLKGLKSQKSLFVSKF